MHKENEEITFERQYNIQKHGEEGETTHRKDTRGVFYPNTKHLWALQIFNVVENEYTCSFIIVSLDKKKSELGRFPFWVQINT